VRFVLVTALLAFLTRDAVGQILANPAGSADPEPPWTLEIFPLLVWAPVFGASVNLPSLPQSPELPGGSPPASGTTSTSFNGAAMTGVLFQKGRFITEFNAMWAGVSSSRTSPHTTISTQGFYGDLIGGFQISHGIALTAGVRHMGLKVGAEVDDFPKVHWKPGVWDPLVGLDWRARFGRSWTTELRLEGGGFGVGSDVDVSASFRADWRFAHHFGVTFGYGALHFQNTDTILNRDFKTKQTFNGPIFGFGIYI
jgi:hypothetical protein